MFNINGIHFKIADTDKLKEEIYQLRYKVYVTEFKFEKPSDHPHGLEQDMYDRHSVHLAGICRKTNKVIATLRLVKNSGIGLPINNIKEFTFRWADSDIKNIIEISRLAIDKAYRRAEPDLFFEKYVGKQRTKPVALFGLYRLLYQESKRLGVTHWTMISESHLHEALTSMGYLFYPIGHKINYHGLRVPYLASVREMEAFWLEQKQGTFKFLAKGLKRRYWPDMPGFTKMMLT